MPGPKRRKPSAETDTFPNLPSAPKRPSPHVAAWERWEGAAEKFNGLDDRMMAEIELRHISRSTTGYQIRISRGGRRVFDRHVAGFSQKSLLEAMRMRDEALLQWPDTVRTNEIPARVLRALGLPFPVNGICRWPARSVYRVHYRGSKGRQCLRQFSYRVVDEEIAYAAAIVFVQNVLTKREAAYLRYNRPKR